MEGFSKVSKRCGKNKTIDHFKKTRWGTRVNVCTECAIIKRNSNKIKKQQEIEMEQAHEDAKKSERPKLIEQFTPRELMEELARRGYTGELTYTMKIDITDF